MFQGSVGVFLDNGTATIVATIAHELGLVVLYPNICLEANSRPLFWGGLNHFMGQFFQTHLGSCVYPGSPKTILKIGVHQRLCF